MYSKFQPYFTMLFATKFRPAIDLLISIDNIIYLNCLYY